MATITALQIQSYGTLENVKAEVIEKPKRSKESEVLVRVKAASANPADFLFVSGHYLKKASSFPCGVGMEGAGIVEEAGKESGVKEGQRVHFVSLGSWAEYIVIDTSAHDSILVPIPDAISFEEAAQLTVNPLTATGTLAELNPQQGEYVVQNAAASALGRMLIQLAKAKGVKTINIVRRDEHIESLKAIGADYVINSEKEDVNKRINELCPGGAKYVLDPVGGKGMVELLKSLAVDGTLICYGALGGLNVDLELASLIFKGLHLKGFNLNIWIQKRGAMLKKEYESIFASIIEKKLQLTYQSFDGKTDFKKAFNHATTPGKIGKTILTF